MRVYKLKRNDFISEYKDTPEKFGIIELREVFYEGVENDLVYDEDEYDDYDYISDFSMDEVVPPEKAKLISKFVERSIKPNLKRFGVELLAANVKDNSQYLLIHSNSEKDEENFFRALDDTNDYTTKEKDGILKLYVELYAVDDDALKYIFGYAI